MRVRWNIIASRLCSESMTRTALSDFRRCVPRSGSGIAGGASFAVSPRLLLLRVATRALKSGVDMRRAWVGVGVSVRGGGEEALLATI